MVLMAFNLVTQSFLPPNSTTPLTVLFCKKGKEKIIYLALERFKFTPKSLAILTNWHGKLFCLNLIGIEEESQRLLRLIVGKSFSVFYSD